MSRGSALSLARGVLQFAALVAAVALSGAASGAKAAPAGSGPSWSSAVAISPTNQPDPTRGSQLNAIAVNANGDAIAAWDQYTYSNGGGATIGAAVQTGGRWAAPFTISGATGFSTTPKVAVAPNGTMAVSWVYQDPVATTASPQQKIQVAVKPAGTSSWTTTSLDSFTIGGVAITTPVAIAFDGAGNLTAAWTHWDGARHLVRTATLAKGAAWSQPVTVSDAIADDGLYFSLAVNASGDAAIVYTLSPYTTYSTGTSAKFVFRSGPNGTGPNSGWTTPAVISETLMAWVGYVTGPQVALDANGLATVIYMSSAIKATRQRADGTWTTPTDVLVAPAAGSSYMSADLAVDNDGNAVAALSIFDATVGVDRASVWVTRGTPAGVWTPQQRLTDPAVPVDAYATRVAVSADGTLALVGWIDHYHGAVQVSQLDSPLKTSTAAWGAAKTIGRGTAFASFQEVLGLAAGSNAQARAVWKNTAKGGTRTMASSYR